MKKRSAWRESSTGSWLAVWPGKATLRNDIDNHGLHGILVLEGTWSPAKTLWWRNPRLLKLPRIALNPREPEATRDTFRRLMRTMLQRVRDHGKPGA